MKKIKNLIKGFIMLLIPCIMNGQTKYNGQDQDCDPNLLPSPGTYKIHVESGYRENSVSASTPVTLPCETYYEIRSRRKENETVWWQYNSYILIEIFPANQKNEDDSSTNTTK